ncbi:hypothetical protein NEIG_01549 [Nematocida sp. ERTm5]|nr:hypothetical protein NEIRO02_1183 [Nematocida sp. AWRm79]KAI5182874.1 hypothetical protein NEIRO03_0514 [Nematocida sp. AWRm78]OAG32976.1 hypothetical protein NEIG_01549 [Nematocida sp. ERTm5]
MVYPHSCKENKRTAILGRVTETTPNVQVECTNKTISVLFTKPNNLERNEWVRLFGSYRNGAFIADAFNRVTACEAVYFERFRKKVREFYRRMN